MPDLLLDMPAAASISVLIVSYNVRALLERNLASIFGAHEIIVVDNASSDGSAAMVRDRYPAVRLIASPTNDGFGRAVNRARAVATGEALLLLNPDAQLGPDSISCLQALLAKKKSVAAAGVRQVDAAGRFQLACGLRPTLPVELARRFVQRRIDAKNPYVGPCLDTFLTGSRTVDWVAGSCLLVRAEAFDAVGGFDERFFLFFEDIDFCLRLKARGFMIVYESGITVTHLRGASAKTRPRAAQRAYRESQKLFSELWGGPMMRWVVPWWVRRRGETEPGCA